MTGKMRYKQRHKQKGNKLRMLFYVALVLFMLTSSVAYATDTTPAASGDSGKPQSDTSASGFRFIVMSDTNPGGNNEGLNANFPKVLAGIPPNNPVFVIDAGDMIAGVGGKNPTVGADKVDRMWASYFGAIKAVTDAKIPILPAPGNHDKRYTKDLQEGYSRDWLKNYPAPPYNAQGNYPVYYSFDYSNNHFIILDSSNVKLGSTQMQWLSEDLKNAKNKDNTFVILHVPFMASGMFHATEEADKAALDLIANAGVKYVFAGHNHVYREHDYKGVKQITAGSAADDPRGEKDNMFLVVDVLGKDNVKLYPASLGSGFRKTLDGQDIPSAPKAGTPGFNPSSLISEDCVPGASGNAMSALMSGEGLSYESFPYNNGNLHVVTVDPNRYDVKYVTAKKATGKAKATLVEIIAKTPGAVAGINGGFFEGSGKQTNTGVEDGEIVKGVYDKFSYSFVNENGRFSVIKLQELISYGAERIRSSISSAVTSMGLVFNGNNVACASGDCNKITSRSAVCVTKEGAVKIIAATGVLKGNSLVGGGSSIKDFAQEAIDKQGCVNGVNLDGGGSTSLEFHANGKDVSLKEEGNGRPVADVMVVVPKQNPTQAAGAPAGIMPQTTAAATSTSALTGAVTAVDAITGSAVSPDKGYAVDLSQSLKTIITSPENLQIRSSFEITGQELATPKAVLDKANQKGLGAVAVTNGAFFGYSSLAGKENGKTNAGPTCLFIENGRQFFPYEYPDNNQNPDFLCKNRYEFYITRNNEAGILPYPDFESKYKGNSYADIKYAVQGVNILYDGNVVTQYPKDIEFTFHEGVKERNGICITNDNKIMLFVNTEKIGLVDLASKLKGLNCRYAINTDGGATSSMYSAENNYYFKGFGDDPSKNDVCKTIKSSSSYLKKAGGEAQGHGCALNFFIVTSSAAGAVAGTGQPISPVSQVGCACSIETTSSLVTKSSADSSTQSSTAPSGFSYDFSQIDSASRDFGAKKQIDKLSKFEPQIKEASQKFGVPEEFIKGIIMTESNGNTLPAGGSLCNSAGYCGLMQINQGKCIDSLGCNWDNFQKGDEGAKDQIFGGTNYIKTLMEKYNLAQKSSPDYFYWIAVGYNGGPTSAGNIRKFAAERLGIAGDKVQWKDITKEDTKRNQESIANFGTGKIDEVYNYPSKVMSVVSSVAGGQQQVMAPTDTKFCSYGQIYDYTTIGKYYINPSLTIYLDYNINDYKAISEQVRQIVPRCQGMDSGKLRECVKSAAKDISTIGSLSLYEGPCDYQENMLSDFAEALDACLKSDDDNCTCEIPLEYDYDKGDEEATISVQQGTLKISSENPAIAPITLSGSASETKTFRTKEKKENYYAKKLGNTIYFGQKEKGDCSVEKRTFKFCAKTKTAYNIYDENSGSIVKKPIEYKFALEFP